MFYNKQTQEILNSCPLDGYLLDGSLVQGLNIADFNTQKSCGILPILSDTPEQPANTIEDESQRIVNIENDEVSILRTWISAPVVIPETISARQIRLWLIDNNINLNSVDEAINTIQDEKLRAKTLVEWEFAPYIERNHPLIESLALYLGLTSQQIDQGFIEAAIL
jgi:hypothetical protein